MADDRSGIPSILIYELPHETVTVDTVPAEKLRECLRFLHDIQERRRKEDLRFAATLAARHGYAVIPQHVASEVLDAADLEEERVKEE